MSTNHTRRCVRWRSLVHTCSGANVLQQQGLELAELVDRVADSLATKAACLDSAILQVTATRIECALEKCVVRESFEARRTGMESTRAVGISLMTTPPVSICSNAYQALWISRVNTPAWRPYSESFTCSTASLNDETLEMVHTGPKTSEHMTVERR